VNGSQRWFFEILLLLFFCSTAPLTIRQGLPDLALSLKRSLHTFFAWNWSDSFVGSGFVTAIISMEEKPLLLLGIAFCLTTIVLLLSQRQRDVLLSRFRLRGRRTSSAKTPPRSLSPNEAPVSAALTANEWLDTFAPTQREALVQAAKSLPPKQRKKIATEQVSQDVLKESIMPFTADYTKCDGSRYTATGLSIDEIKALGNFPDYAELSGVPLPDAYTDFNIETAMPRPYRPFRWAYYQTMCKPRSCSAKF